ncbi:MAG: hypothetical protein EG823_09240 [Actinobacteria bacterium]|nr:hypothetical protein [Actinomycetota bacterium]
MSADQEKSRFEPPPWEREAFDDFRRKQDEQKAQEELNAALRTVREEPQPAEPAAAQPNVPAGAEQPVAPGEPGNTAMQAPQAEPVSQARIDAMLIELRGEEPPAVRDYKPLVNAVIIFMAIAGVVIVVQSALLFGDVQTSNSAAKMLAATMSFMVFATGLGFLGGAFLLYRKYRR